MTTPRNTILVGDASEQMGRLASASADCIITSPPYYALRDYGVDGQIGLEDNVEAWAERLRRVFAGAARVLKPTGCLWLNVGDSFSRHRRYGAPPKSLLLAPERLLLKLAADGWLVRNKVIWSKPNPMPASVGDRLNLTYEAIFLLARCPSYFFDLDAIRIPHRSAGGRSETAAIDVVPAWAGPLAGKQDGLRRMRPPGQPGHRLGKNPGDVWVIPTRGYRGAHFATFPEAVVERPLLATCPEAICTRCDKPWVRQRTVHHHGAVRPAGREEHGRRYPTRWLTTYEVGPLVPCGCGAPTRPGVVLDPFMGVGTTAVVAERHGRDWVGIELNPAYAALARERVRAAELQRRAA